MERADIQDYIERGLDFCRSLYTPRLQSRNEIPGGKARRRRRKRNSMGLCKRSDPVFIHWDIPASWESSGIRQSGKLIGKFAQFAQVHRNNRRLIHECLASSIVLEEDKARGNHCGDGCAAGEI